MTVTFSGLFPLTPQVFSPSDLRFSLIDFATGPL
jgi:hypothetical protein